MSVMFKSIVQLSKQTNVHKGEFIRNYGKIGVLGIPCEDGQQKYGVSLAPDALRKFGIIKNLTDLGNEVKDFGDVTFNVPDTPNGTGTTESINNMNKLRHIAACQRQTSTMVEKILNQGYQCLCLGGDHSAGIGTVDGHVKARKDVAVLWIDAHADLNTCATSPTGNVHGMPVALLVKELSDYWPYLPDMDWQVPVLSAKNVAYIGLRDIDAYERIIIEKFNIAAFGMEEVSKYGINDVIQQALSRIDPNNNRSLHISFDIDSLDPLEAPSTGTAVRGGLTLREGIKIMEEVHKTKRVYVMDLVEVNPLIGSLQDLKTTLEAAQLIIKAAFGCNRQGSIIPNVTEIPFPDVSQSQRSKN